jgi:hypothetical protein
LYSFARRLTRVLSLGMCPLGGAPQKVHPPFSCTSIHSIPTPGRTFGVQRASVADRVVADSALRPPCDVPLTRTSPYRCDSSLQPRSAAAYRVEVSFSGQPFFIFDFVQPPGGPKRSVRVYNTARRGKTARLRRQQRAHRIRIPLERRRPWLATAPSTTCRSLYHLFHHHSLVAFLIAGDHEFQHSSLHMIVKFIHLVTTSTILASHIESCLTRQHRLSITPMRPLQWSLLKL